MMTIWAPSATFTQGPGQTMVGTEEIRRAWLATKPFDPTTHWVSETPAYKVRATVNGDKGTLLLRMPLRRHEDQEGRAGHCGGYAGCEDRRSLADHEHGRWICRR